MTKIYIQWTWQDAVEFVCSTDNGGTLEEVYEGVRQLMPISVSKTPGWKAVVRRWLRRSREIKRLDNGRWINPQPPLT